MTTLQITHRFLSVNDLLSSRFPAEWFGNFGMKHIMEDKIKRYEVYNPTFYIVNADSTHNYGIDFNIYVSYNADGINFLKQICTTSSITSAPLRRVTIDSNTITFGTQGYSKSTNEAREGLRHASICGWIFAN